MKPDLSAIQARAEKATDETLRELRNDNPYDFNSQNFSFVAHDDGVIAAHTFYESYAAELEAKLAAVASLVSDGPIYGASNFMRRLRLAIASAAESEEAK